MKRSYGFGLGVALAATTLAPRALAVDYGAKGTHTYKTTDLPANAGGSIGGSLVVPDDAGPFPLIIASHGWSASAANQVGWAELFASWGFVVVAPSFPNPLSPDFNVNEGIIASLVTMYQSPTTDSPAKGKVDPARLGLEGHSAGGLATTLAADALKPQATVLFDPVDSADAGKGAYSAICSPLLGIFANGSSCNNQAEWSTFKAESVGPATLFNVVGSSHCDGENADRGVACGLFCGGAADPARQAVYGRYATAFFLAHLQGDSAAAATLAETALDADTMITGVSVHDAPSCAATVPGSDGGVVGEGDSGVPASGGGGGDGGGGGTGGAGGTGSGGLDASSHGGADATTGGSSGNGDTTGDPSDPGATSSGCGCEVASLAGGKLASTYGIGLAIAGLAFVRRRRAGRA